jgi:N-acetylmuramate 1-kinase
MNISVYQDGIDQRLKAIFREMGSTTEMVTPLAGDASARRFFRVSAQPLGRGESCVLILFPLPARKEIFHYLLQSICLQQAGLPVPELYQSGYDSGFLLVEDCGDDHLQGAASSLPKEDLRDLYLMALDLLLKMQKEIVPERYPDSPATRTAFDQKTFNLELQYFLTHTIEGYYKARISPEDRDAFDSYFSSVCREVISQPMFYCHRDYHSRNLMVSGGSLRLIDFQDARMGPYTYDLVSLLEDPYVDLSTEFRCDLKAYYLDRLARQVRKNIIKDFNRDYDMMSIQRLLKAAGTFGYMFMEKGKPGYVEHLMTVFRRVKEILVGYPELTGLNILLKKYTARV